MSIQATKKLSTTEKKLQTLRTQLYGKNKVESVPQVINTQTLTQINLPTNSLSSTTIDTNYLRKDIQKICLLAALAITAQILIYFLIQKGIRIPGL